MCGINGILSDSLNESEQAQLIKAMNAALHHRGPDDTGFFQDGKIALGHTRLAIIDLSANGHQPFFSGDQRYVMVFNGEIYNYRELKLELQRVAQGSSDLPYFFRTDTDTEVVMAAFIRWGARCLNYFNGMFAFAIYDTHKNSVFIARDRMGVKPLYFNYSDKGFIFSSEVRAILKSGIQSFSLNHSVLAEYVQYQTVSAPNTIVKGIQVLPAGHYLEIIDQKVHQTAYWQAPHFITTTNALSYSETCQTINELLSLSVQRRLIADVPFGAFLSGGIDSSIVVGLMAKVSSEPIQTFNVSFDEDAFSESVYARSIAKRFNTQHHEIRLTPQDFLNDLPNALMAMDHPGGDGINTYVVAKATRKAGITMALSGIGGDELFAGYPNFKRLHHLQHDWRLKLAPPLARKLVALGLECTSTRISKAKIAEVLRLPDFGLRQTYPLSRSLFTKKELDRLVKDSSIAWGALSFLESKKMNANAILSYTSVLEMNSYLQNVLLRDTDQMAMAVALEVREPFLDVKLVEFVLGVNDTMKFPHSPKKLLVDSVEGLIPKEITERSKMGFLLPWANWMRLELKPFCEAQILSLENKQIFKPGAILELWKRFLQNDKQVTWSRIWHFITLNYWMEATKIEI